MKTKKSKGLWLSMTESKKNILALIRVVDFYYTSKTKEDSTSPEITATCNTLSGMLIELRGELLKEGLTNTETIKSPVLESTLSI